MKHAKPETPLERADRLIGELQDDGERNGQHRPDMAYLDITPEMISLQEQINIMSENVRRAFSHYASIKDWS